MLLVTDSVVALTFRNRVSLEALAVPLTKTSMIIIAVIEHALALVASVIEH